MFRGVGTSTDKGIGLFVILSFAYIYLFIFFSFLHVIKMFSIEIYMNYEARHWLFTKLTEDNM